MAPKKRRGKRDKRRAGAKQHAQDMATLWSWVRSGRFRFALAFTLSCLGLYWAIYSLPPSLTGTVNEHTAAALGMLLNVLGFPVTTVRDTVSGGGLAFRIIPECTPLFSSCLFACFIAFHPAALSQKAVGLVMGIPALYLGNLVRLAATYVVSLHDRRLFDVVHAYLGQVFTIFLVIMVCLFWLKWLERQKTGAGAAMKAAGFLGRFALISGCLFLVWLRLHHWYIWCLDRLMLIGFSLFGYRVELAHDTSVYYETFSIVITVSLVLAARKIPGAMRIRGLAIGLGALVAFHLLHRIDNVLIAYFNATAVLPVDLTLLVVGQYMVPAILLYSLIRSQRTANP